MSESSATFAKQSHDLERIMFYRKLKLNIIIGIVILGILAYILIPIITDSSKDNSKKFL